MKEPNSLFIKKYAKSASLLIEGAMPENAPAGIFRTTFYNKIRAVLET